MFAFHFVPLVCTEEDASNQFQHSANTSSKVSMDVIHEVVHLVVVVAVVVVVVGAAVSLLFLSDETRFTKSYFYNR